MFKMIFLPNSNLQRPYSRNNDIKYFKPEIYDIIVYDHIIDKGDFREGKFKRPVSKENQDFGYKIGFGWSR